MSSIYFEFFVRLICYNERIFMVVLLRIKERMLVGWVIVIVIENIVYCVVI